jgi:hypothetical protein
VVEAAYGSTRRYEYCVVPVVPSRFSPSSATLSHIFEVVVMEAHAKAVVGVIPNRPPKYVTVAPSYTAEHMS